MSPTPKQPKSRGYSPDQFAYSHSSRGIWASLDLLLAFLILISVLAPLLTSLHSDLQLREQSSLSQQRLSVLLQQSQLLYSSQLTPHQSLDLTQITPSTVANPQSYYSKDGYLNPIALAQTSIRIPTQAPSLGLSHLELSLLPPTPSNPNQICVQRLMLLPPVQTTLNDPSSPLPPVSLTLLAPTPTRVWVCGW